jgi:hypothetical protein
MFLTLLFFQILQKPKNKSVQAGNVYIHYTKDDTAMLKTYNLVRFQVVH